MRAFLGLMALVVIASCATDNPSLYLLQPVNVREPADRAPGRSIGVREVVLPAYARDARLPERTASGAIVHLDGHRWADSPARAVTRTFAANMRQITGATVLVEPWPPGFRPEVIVAVQFDVFDATRGQTAEMAGQYTLFQADGSAKSDYTPFAMSTKVEGPTFKDVTAAISVGLLSLAKQVQGISPAEPSTAP